MKNLSDESDVDSGEIVPSAWVEARRVGRIKGELKSQEAPFMCHDAIESINLHLSAAGGRTLTKREGKIALEVIRKIAAACYRLGYSAGEEASGNL